MADLNLTFQITAFKKSILADRHTMHISLRDENKYVIGQIPLGNRSQAKIVLNGRILFYRYNTCRAEMILGI